MRKISVLGLSIGGVVSFFAAIALSLPFTIYAVLHLDLAHQANQPQAAAAFRAFAFTNPIVYYGGQTIDCICCILGGYVAAIAARRSEALNGLLSSLPYLAIELAIGEGLDPHPATVRVLHVGSIVISSLLGGYLRARRVRAFQNKQSWVGA